MANGTEIKYDITNPLVQRYLAVEKSQKWGETILEEMGSHGRRIEALREKKDSNPEEVIKVMRRIQELTEKFKQAKRDWKEFRQLKETEAVQEFLKLRAEWDREESERKRGLYTK